MNEFSGTPNIWNVRDGINLEIIADKTGFGVVCFGDAEQLKEADYPKDTALANARLMAAAPELLEALKTLYNAYFDRDNTGSDEQLYKAEAAINKALGK